MVTVIKIHKGQAVLHTFIVDKPCNLMEEGMRLMNKFKAATGFSVLTIEAE